jgi:6-phosphofructokinase 1
MAEKGNLLYGQSGGPTSVINASAYGVLSSALEAQKQGKLGKVLTARFGVQGILEDDISPLSAEQTERLPLLTHTPGAAFGSCRHMLKDYEEDETEYLKILEVFKKNNIRYFLLNGGNDSMDTIAKLDKYFTLKAHYDCRCIGIPKTIDNDLPLTDHTPGYGSAAKYIATSCLSIDYDARCYQKGRINIVEVMGRDTGWLTASAGLANIKDQAVDFIYIPESPFDTADFLNKVEALFAKKKRVLAAVSEGIRDQGGQFIAESGAKDAFGHAQLGGAASYLSSLVKNAGYPTRAIELSLAQRSFSSLASKTDVTEAVNAGVYGVKCALKGQSGQMVAFQREEAKAGYQISYVLVPLAKVGGQIKYLPPTMYDAKTASVTEEFLDYASPLIEGEAQPEFCLGLPLFF